MSFCSMPSAAHPYLDPIDAGSMVRIDPLCGSSGPFRTWQMVL
jgi:hypothetical protein